MELVIKGGIIGSIKIGMMEIKVKVVRVCIEGKYIETL